MPLITIRTLALFEAGRHGIEGKGMKISIFGLGYVGAVSLACLARDGHDLISSSTCRTSDV